MASGLLLRVRHSLGQIWSSLGQGWDPFWNICGSSLLMWWEVLKPLGDCGRRRVGMGGNSLRASFHLLSMREFPQQVRLSPEKVTVGLQLGALIQSRNAFLRGEESAMK